MDAEAEAPVLWTPDAKSQLTGKGLMLERLWAKGVGVAEDEMIGWHHQLNGHKYEQTPGDSEGQRSLTFYSPWDRKESDMT